jgi:hypothetical protein
MQGRGLYCANPSLCGNQPFWRWPAFTEELRPTKAYCTLARHLFWRSKCNARAAATHFEGEQSQLAGFASQHLLSSELGPSTDRYFVHFLTATTLPFMDWQATITPNNTGSACTTHDCGSRPFDLLGFVGSLLHAFLHLLI